MCSSPVIASLCSSSSLLSAIRQNFNLKHRKSFVHRKSKKDRSFRLRLVYQYKASEQRTTLWLVLFFFLFFVLQLLEILKNSYIFAPLSEHLAFDENSMQALNINKQISERKAPKMWASKNNDFQGQIYYHIFLEKNGGYWVYYPLNSFAVLTAYRWRVLNRPHLMEKTGRMQ